MAKQVIPGNYNANPGFKSSWYSDAYNRSSYAASIDYDNYKRALQYNNLAYCSKFAALFYNDLGHMADAAETDDNDTKPQELSDIADKMQLIPADLNALYQLSLHGPFPDSADFNAIYNTISNPISSTDGLLKMAPQAPGNWDSVIVSTDADGLAGNSRFIQNPAGEPQFQTSDLGNPLMGWAAPPAGVNLFNPTTGPSPDDITQGQLGDCWYLAALQSVANSPSGQALLQRNITQKPGTNPPQYNVTFNAAAMQAAAAKINAPLQLASTSPTVTVTVDAPLPTKNGAITYAQLANNTDWVAIYEKAAAKFFSFENVSFNGLGSIGYQGLNGGFPSIAYAAITGDSDVTCRTISNVSQDQLQQKIAAVMNDYKGNVWVAAKAGAAMPPNSRIVPQHTYSIMSISPYGPYSAGLVTLRDTWGSKPQRGAVFTMTMPDFYRAFVDNGTGGILEYTNSGNVSWGTPEPSNSSDLSTDWG